MFPAGNDHSRDLDTYATFPASLGNIQYAKDMQTARHIIVVGAATQELRRPIYSNYGEDTVMVFAPGEATGALDIIGKGCFID